MYKYVYIYIYIYIYTLGRPRAASREARHEEHEPAAIIIQSYVSKGI